MRVAPAEGLRAHPPASRRRAWRASSVRRRPAAASFRPPYVPDITARSALDRVRRSLRSSGPLNEASISRVQVGCGRFVLPAAGGPVDLEDHPAGGGPRFDQLKRSVRAVVGEQPRALADDTQLDSFTFFISMSGTVVVRGELYAWDGQKATGPNLFESAPRTISNTSGFEEVTFDTGGVQLVAGQQYVLFATISKDYAASDGSGAWEAVFSGDPYPGGNFVYMNNGSSFDQLFTEAWGQIPEIDSAFKAVFSTSASDSPTTTQECKNNGWKNFENPDGSPMFKNQGDCVRYVATH